MLHRATAMASCAGVRVVRRQWGLCGYDPEHVAFAPFPDSLLRRSVAFCGVQPRPTQAHHAPEWPLVSLVSLSLGYDVEQTLVSPV
ncbi:MAG: hypothetical protein QNL02_13840 [Paracoccaceae bacterium]